MSLLISKVPNRYAAKLYRWSDAVRAPAPSESYGVGTDFAFALDARRPEQMETESIA